jgi:GAF domain-containing protein
MVITPDEEERVATLRSCRIMDTPRDDQFDNVAFAAAQICRTPIALITFIDSERVWIKSRIGLHLLEVARADCLCSSIFTCPDMLVIEDARHDARFSGIKYVNEPPFIRFYGGTPVRAGPGLTVGVLCVIDTRPRILSAEQHRGLAGLARQVEKLL